MVLINTYQFEWALHDDGIHCIQSCRTSYYYQGFIKILAYYIAAPHSIHFCHKILIKLPERVNRDVSYNNDKIHNIYFSLTFSYNKGKQSLAVREREDFLLSGPSYFLILTPGAWSRTEISLFQLNITGTRILVVV